MSAANVLTQRWPAPTPECFLSTTERRVAPRAQTPGQRDLVERSSNARVAMGPLPRAAGGDLWRALDVPMGLPIVQARLREGDDAEPTTRGVSDARIEALPSADGERIRVSGSVPRSIASLIAVSDTTMPAGDPIVMSFVLHGRGDAVTVESANFHFGDRVDARRERAYAFAESRATNQVLAALLSGVRDDMFASSPVVERAYRTLGDIASFEDGPEPGVGPARVVYRAARLQRSQTYAIARALSSIYDCGLEPRTPSMVDEPRERPIAQAFLAASLGARNLDPALLYAVASDEGLPHDVQTWHRGIAGISIPSRIDADRIAGMSSIADEAAALRREGYLSSWFDSAVRGEDGRYAFVATGARSALTNALTFSAARLAYSKERALAAAGRLAPNRELDERTLVFLTLLQAEGGDIAVQRYLQDRRLHPMLPTTDEVRASRAVARAFSRTAMWEQMSRTGVFERAP